MDKKYHVDHQIGEGCFGKVFKGRRRFTGQAVALKCIAKKNRSARDLENLRTEIDILQKLNHPNIIKCIDSFDTITDIVVVTELGFKDLGSIFPEETRLEENIVRLIARQLCSALEYLHRHRVLHRDLKPQNILIGPNSRVKLADFGFARAMSQQTMVLTSIKGTPLYMAPELVKQQPYDFKADIWSMGIILFELFNGNTPFIAKSIYVLAEVVCKTEVKHHLKTSPVFRHFLDGLLTKNPAKRSNWEWILPHPFLSASLSTASTTSNTPSTTRAPSPRGPPEAVETHSARLPHSGTSSNKVLTPRGHSPAGSRANSPATQRPKSTSSDVNIPTHPPVPTLQPSPRGPHLSPRVPPHTVGPSATTATTAATPVPPLRMTTTATATSGAAVTTRTRPEHAAALTFDASSFRHYTREYARRVEQALLSRTEQTVPALRFLEEYVIFALKHGHMDTDFIRTLLDGNSADYFADERTNEGVLEVASLMLRLPGVRKSAGWRRLAWGLVDKLTEKQMTRRSSGMVRCLEVAVRDVVMVDLAEMKTALSEAQEQLGARVVETCVPLVVEKTSSERTKKAAVMCLSSVLFADQGGCSSVLREFYRNSLRKLLESPRLLEPLLVQLLDCVEETGEASLKILQMVASQVMEGSGEAFVESEEVSGTLHNVVTRTLPVFVEKRRWIEVARLLWLMATVVEQLYRRADQVSNEDVPWLDPIAFSNAFGRVDLGVEAPLLVLAGYLSLLVHMEPSRATVGVVASAVAKAFTTRLMEKRESMLPDATRRLNGECKTDSQWEQPSGVLGIVDGWLVQLQSRGVEKVEAVLKTGRLTAEELVGGMGMSGWTCMVEMLSRSELRAGGGELLVYMLRRGVDLKDRLTQPHHQDWQRGMQEVGRMLKHSIEKMEDHEVLEKAVYVSGLVESLTKHLLPKYGKKTVNTVDYQLWSTLNTILATASNQQLTSFVNAEGLKLICQILQNLPCDGPDSNNKTAHAIIDALNVLIPFFRGKVAVDLVSDLLVHVYPQLCNFLKSRISDIRAKATHVVSFVFSRRVAKLTKSFKSVAAYIMEHLLRDPDDLTRKMATVAVGTLAFSGMLSELYLPTVPNLLLYIQDPDIRIRVNSMSALVNFASYCDGVFNLLVQHNFLPRLAQIVVKAAVDPRTGVVLDSPELKVCLHGLLYALSKAPRDLWLTPAFKTAVQRKYTCRECQVYADRLVFRLN